VAFNDLYPNCFGRDTVDFVKRGHNGNFPDVKCCLSSISNLNGDKFSDLYCLCCVVLDRFMTNKI